MMVSRPVGFLLCALVLWLFVGASCDDRVLSVQIVGGDVALAVGETRLLTADVKVIGKATQGVEWVSANPAIASVTGAGLVTAVAQGVTEVTATSAWDRSMSGSIEVTVTLVVPVVSVSVAPLSVMLSVNGTQSFTASVSGASDTSVSWSATCGSVAGSGNTVTYTAPGSEGTCLVRATSVAHEEAWAEATVTVEAAFERAPTYITIENVSVGAPSERIGGPRLVSFDIGWPESWRGPDRPSWVAAPDNWDAVWVFVKYRVSGGAWQHATLAGSGHVAPSGAVVSVPSDGVGAFVYRSSSGYGTFAANGVGLQWDSDVPAHASVEVVPFGIEMVYVPRGAFRVGSGGSSSGEFRIGLGTNDPAWVSSQSSIELGQLKDLTWIEGTYTGSPAGSTHASFPTGYEAFYVMKYQVTQGQYVDFLNTLTQTQATYRKYTGSSYRYAITGSSVGPYATSLPYVAMNYISWADGAAFADWAGLRPMTELEFEKAARGTRAPVADEYAWGSTSITQATLLDFPGTIGEIPRPYPSSWSSPPYANAAFGSAAGVQGPVRVGSFTATWRAARDRRDAGSGYYGALELSGNLWEVPVTVGNAEGRAFAGTHGDGTLDANGNANVVSWPGSTAVGAGFRGGSWRSVGGNLLVSDRFFAARTGAFRGFSSGWRGARSAP